jgi:predicted outer membrane repeat protein
MSAKRQQPFIANFVFVIVLLVGLFGVTPASASSDALPQINISTPSYPIGMNSRESKLIPYGFTESNNVSGKITSRMIRFYTQYDIPLSEPFGPYSTNININSLQTREWNELVYLPESVVNKARALKEYAIVLKTTFIGKSSSGADFSTQASLLILLPPDAFSKNTPTNGALVAPTNQSLQWNSSVGAIDYEYCMDSINNNSCDTNWTGTYDTNAALQNLPLNTTFYWQVRANNTAGTTYANNGDWWSFTTTTCISGPILVTNTNDSGNGSLRKAIADICPGGMINFVSSLSGQIIILTSQLAIDKDLTIDGSGLNPRVEISGGDSVKIFAIGWGYGVDNLNVVLRSLILRNARWLGTSYFDTGAAIFMDFLNTLTVEDVTFQANYAAGEGAAIHSGGTVTVINSEFISNSSQSSGGAIFIHPTGRVTVKNSRFVNNSAVGAGGAIAVQQNWSLSVEETTFDNNSALSGGAISIVNSNGGNGTAVNIRNSLFASNTASNGVGGAIQSVYFSNSPAVIENNTFFANHAAVFGGAISTENGVTLKNNTFSENDADATGSPGASLYLSGANADASLYNNIFANNTGGGECGEFSAPDLVVTGNTNIVEDASGRCGSLPGTIVSDPLLGPLADNGGLTQTMALLPGSPAIDAGDSANCPSTDQRGVVRPQGSKCDIGAFEAPNPLFLSFNGSQTIGGVSSSDEDILRFDGSNWSMFFDGSDVGVGSPDLFAFSIVDADTILMAFSANVTVNGIAATPQDVLRFDATSLGSNTAGTFSMYFDGSDVGFDTTAEKIDSVSLLSDGRLLISTIGNPIVTGITAGRDEDILAFTPTSLGDSTSGTWSMYFDGSDVGLGETSGEDIDALDVVNGKIYLSTLDTFSVHGLTGADKDVFVCTPTSLGSTTACNYSSSLYFDGSAWGLAGNDVDAINLLTTGSLPTPTPTNTPGGPTSTPTPTPTQTPTATITPTRTATPQPGPHLRLQITPNPTSFNGVGQFIVYTYTLTNTGSVPLNGPYSVSDNKVSFVDCSSAASPLAVGASTTCVGSYATTQADVNAGSITNSATAMASDGTQMIISNIATATVSSPWAPTLTPTSTPTPTNTAGSSDVIFADSFESGNLSAWTSSTTDGGDLSVSTAAALKGSQGMQAVIDDTTAIYVTDDTPNAEPRYRMRFYFDPNSLTMANGDSHIIFRGFAGSSTIVLRIEFGFSSGAYQIRAGLLNDGSTWTETNWFTISDASHAIEVDWRAATAAGANDGGLTLWIDGSQQADLTGIDNDTRRVDRARLGPVASLDAGTSGTSYFDAFESRRQTYIGP